MPVGLSITFDTVYSCLVGNSLHNQNNDESSLKNMALWTQPCLQASLKVPPNFLTTRCKFLRFHGESRQWYRRYRVLKNSFKLFSFVSNLSKRQFFRGDHKQKIEKPKYDLQQKCKNRENTRNHMIQFRTFSVFSRELIIKCILL